MLKTLIRNWKKRAAKEQFENGYNYAAGELLKGDKTPIQLEAEQSCDYDDFDRGMDAAIIDAINKKFVEDDRI